MWRCWFLHNWEKWTQEIHFISNEGRRIGHEYHQTRVCKRCGFIQHHVRREML